MKARIAAAERVAESGYDQMDVMENLLDALGRNDEAAIGEWSRMLEPPADALLAAKRMGGAEFVRERGYITRRAEKKYGKDWLEKSDEELLEMNIRLGPEG